MWQEVSQLRRHLNFYRIHLLCFTLIPLLCALIFWASNGRFHIAFIDALFVCISAVTGTGLSTIDLSSTTAWQQTILVILEITGNQVFVSWVVVYIRRRYFRQHLGHVIRAEVQRTLTRRETMYRTVSHMEAGRSSSRGQRNSSSASRSEHSGERKRASGPIRADMVRRLDAPPRPVNPMGIPARAVTIESTRDIIRDHPPPSARQTEFQLPPSLNGELRHRIPTRTRTRTRTISPARPVSPPVAQTGFGGFPGPREVLGSAAKRYFPRLHKNLQHTLTIPRTATLVPPDQNAIRLRGPTRQVEYLSFVAGVGKNSRFHGLTEEQMLELGGVEYRALNLLLWITPLYYFGILAFSIIIITPYMTLPKWKNVFLPPMQHRVISPVWFSFFQVIGAWANTGMSLVDQNMIPFRTAYLLIIVLIICVLSGNTAFPIFFRLTIWCISKCFRLQSRTRESLQFLLEHPRRCFISLFPSHQTWLLFIVLLLMNIILFAGDLILNIGNPATDAIPVGTRIALAFLSAAAVRSAGFQGVAVSALAPGVQVLYIIMMYIAVYPVAMSVRATNVYEEKSLGIVYDSDDDSDEEEEELEDEVRTTDSRVAIWGKYLMRHMRRQLSFDIWWLALSLLLVCIIERDNLMNTANATWFNIFAVLFELVSGYGTVGLSLGIPFANFSLSGEFHILSKLVVCAVMLRGRHRGLPDALDRAVLLPREFRKRPPQPISASYAPSPLTEEPVPLSAVPKPTPILAVPELPSLREREGENENEKAEMEDMETTSGSLSSSSHASHTVTAGTPEEGKLETMV